MVPTQTPGTASSLVSDWSEVKIPVLSLVDDRVLVFSLADVTTPTPSCLTLTGRLKLSIGTKRAVSRREIKSQADSFKMYTKRTWIYSYCYEWHLNLFPKIQVHTSPLMFPSDQGLTGQCYWGQVIGGGRAGVEGNSPPDLMATGQVKMMKPLQHQSFICNKQTRYREA